MAPAPLPVSLTAFEAQTAGTTATCTTASEINNDHFVVARALDGTTFAALGTVRGQGIRATATSYHFEDAAAGRLGAPVVYYRLQHVDTNGRATYSTVRVVSFRALALYPTPTPGAEAKLDLTSQAPQVYQAQVLDLTGRVLLTHAFVGGKVHAFDVHSLPAGAYVVVISGANVH